MSRVQSVKNLLDAVVGGVEVNWDLSLACRLEDYTNSHLCDTLGLIHGALQKHRGFHNFVKAKKLPRVDFFIPEQRLIIEFYESQHFTIPRDIALGMYPFGQKYGFSVEKWRMLCKNLDRRDNDPPYQDEQRAWYDTLRDFAPVLWRAGRTIRLYSRDLVWCSLNPGSKSDLHTFEQILMNARCGQ